MVTEDLLSYVRKKKQQNIADDTILQELLTVGWKQEDIKQAIIATSNPDIPLPLVPSAPPAAASPKEQKGYHSMWDAFEHILMFISLYVTATALALMLHYFVDKWFPNILYNSYSSSSNYRSSIHDVFVLGYMAALIVAAPLFAFFFVRISKRTETHPEVRMLKARRFLIYLTLVGTFIIIIGYIITFVYSLLKGNITLNFIFHIMVTIGVSGVIFAYYLSEVKEDRRINE